MLAGRRRAERGSATLELLLVTVLLFAAITLLVQVALAFHARQILDAAAHDGARAARAYGARPADGRTAAMASLRQLGGDFVHDPAVTVRRTPTEVTVTVAARLPGILPGTTLRLAATVTSTRERTAT